MDPSGAWLAYRLRWKRRRLLWRAFQARHGLRPVADRTAAIRRGDILGFACVRNEAKRLPWFLAHHRALGVAHFLVVDNASGDGSAGFLAAQPDVSLWTAAGSYRAARYGMDWVNRLLFRYGHGHWCLTLDADEALVIPHHGTRTLADLTGWMDHAGQAALPAMLLDMYARGPIASASVTPGDDPFETLCWFDPDGYRSRRNPVFLSRWIQGGPRERQFLAGTPERAPTLDKTPLLRWNRRFAYANSTHTLLPRRLNRAHERPGAVSAVLLHSKFMDEAVPKAREDLERRAHFHDPDAFRGYYEALIRGPSLWTPRSARYRDWTQLEALGLMSRGDWS
ncbi:MAG: glycosyltransferase family 2 protein [Pseudomonadota bacterium]